MALTVTEKDHFVNRLNSRAMTLGSDINASDPTWERDLTEEAQEIVDDHFDVGELMRQRAALMAQAERTRIALEGVESELAVRVRGRKREDLPIPNQNAYRRYTQEDDDDFERYPSDLRQIIREHCRAQVSMLKRAHPTGQRLHVLQKQCDAFHDRIASCANHKQLQAIWAEACEALDIVEANAQVERQARRVDTTRAQNRNGGEQF